MIDFKGVFTALVTPFDKNNQLDEEGFKFLVNKQIEANVNGIVFLGTTGEIPTITPKEQKKILALGKILCDKKTTFIVGTGNYSTETTIENTLFAEQQGADAALIITPYYNKPTQEGLYQHFKAIAKATCLPIIIYNAPGRTSQNMHTDTLKRLMDIPSIIGVKETSGNLAQITDVIAAKKLLRQDFRVLSGDDELTLPIMTLGGDGVISVISNIVPKEMVQFFQAIQSGNYPLAQDIHYKLLALMRVAFIETNPIPTKTALSLMGYPSGSCRLPLCSLIDENVLKLKKVLHSYKII